ncbi:hypothetical protein ACFQ3J_20965 [Paenibacillus provencensis]|uniref:Uncharacterized protein n=1 Tax=Paenibacillus provencensis TaxID=441151 RepID=A0ABW3PZ36_9BACL
MWANATGSKAAENAAQGPVRTAVGLLHPITRGPKPGKNFPAKAL